MQITNLTDAELFALCQEYGNKARFWRQKFAGLLPEVYRRKLYFQKGFGSIFEFAAKLAGMGEEQVRLVLNLEKKFEDKPVLKALLVNGEVSVNKLARVASIATLENQEVLAGQLKILPQSAIETLVRDEKYVQEKMSDQNTLLRAHSNLQQNAGSATAQNQNLAVPVQIVSIGIPGHATEVKELLLSNEVRSKLFELQQKGIDINALILEFLNKREMEIVQEKEKIAATLSGNRHTSRYIPAKIRKILQKEYGEKCSIDGCVKNSEVVHHTQRFSIGQSHNPKFLAPLCRNHHLIAHSVDRKFITFSDKTAAPAHQR